ncbi:uncharacterized protein [Neodiprion pinetum]|uniref:uncharacterized protein n=1 Tax=Neodiprion pinetum TaxID=441929 RepID=UPI001EDD151C|nr:uncharacterized protein LOC124211255 [Neodiprion pinetum]
MDDLMGEKPFMSPLSMYSTGRCTRTHSESSVGSDSGMSTCTTTTSAKKLKRETVLDGILQRIKTILYIWKMFIYPPKVIFRLNEIQVSIQTMLLVYFVIKRPKNIDPRDCLYFQLEEDYFHDETRNFTRVKTTPTRQDRIKQVFIRGFQKSSPKRRILHDVYEKKSTGRISGHLIQRLCGRHRGSVVIVCDHVDHYHVVHDCSYGNATCRCPAIFEFREFIEFVGRRYSRRVTSSVGYTIQHWINLAIYFEKEGRSIDYLDIAGRKWIPSRETRCIQLQQDLQCGQEELVEGFGTAQHFHDQQCSRPETYSSTTSDCAGSERFDGASGSQKRGKGDRIIEFLRKFPTAPVNHIFGISLWYNSEYKFWNRQSPLFQSIIKIVGNFYNELSVSELAEYFTSLEPQNLIFNAPMGNVQNYYYSPEESLSICEKLIDFQFRSNRREIQNFYETLFNVVDRKVPKKNSLFVLSPPNSGKNFFFDAFIHFCINFGQMGNFNRYCTFPLMECVDRRIILWNEPVMEASASETLKCILGGDTCNAKVKYLGDAVIGRTPVIILSNNDVFPKDEAFRSRIFQYEWRQASFLKDYKKKPHPMVVSLLYNKYIQ